MQTNKKIHSISHPLLEHKISILRDKTTDRKTFRSVIHEITLLLAFPAMADFPLSEKKIMTPLDELTARFLQDKAPVIVPILRAGLGMLDALLQLLPQSKIGYIGLKRNEATLKSECYYFNLPKDSNQRPVIICDPMIATGGSSIEAISRLKEKGIKNMRLINIIGSLEGIEHFNKTHPDVPLFVGAIDKGLNQHSYIVPGLGDCGDRLNGTD